MFRRMEKIDELIKRLLGEIILKNFEFLLGSLVTINKVKTDQNLKETKIYLNVFPVEKAERVFNLLNKKTSFFQKMLAEKLSFRSLPKIKFILNLGFE